ncbi:MAG TPA: nicotinate (nicotinamide) nucleotide adenylyltransferase, partial [Acidimicrobiia bacterium]
MRSGLLGGTFDPPHIAHLLAGEVAYRQLRLDRVIFMPAGSPWQKANRRVSSAHHRWEMTKLAVSGVDYFVADDREVHREGWTYTADTLDTFDPTEEVVLILGADAARGLPTWERSAEVLSRVELAIVPRPGVEMSSS